MVSVCGLPGQPSIRLLLLHGKNGKGDVVQELRKACDKYGLKFGVYLSPWDRNAECYGQGEAYNKFFIEQLTELLTNYGEVHEVWFDWS